MILDCSNKMLTGVKNPALHDGDVKNFSYTSNRGVNPLDTGNSQNRNFEGELAPKNGPNPPKMVL